MYSISWAHKDTFYSAIVRDEHSLFGLANLLDGRRIDFYVSDVNSGRISQNQFEFNKKFERWLSPS